MNYRDTFTYSKQCFKSSFIFLHYQIIESIFVIINDFKNFSELKTTFKSVDNVGDLYVFDIGGNKLRLIASIYFNRQKLYIRHILTHQEYDKNKWKE